MLSRPSMAIVASVVLLLLNVQPVFSVDPDFSTRRNFGTAPDYTLSVAVGDMDGDGDLDIITGNNGQQNVVYLNDGTGNFAADRNFGNDECGARSVDNAIGGLNGGCRAAVVSRSKSVDVQILASDSAIHFAPY